MGEEFVGVCDSGKKYEVFQQNMSSAMPLMVLR